MFSIPLEPTVIKSNRKVASQAFIGVSDLGQSQVISLAKNCTLTQIYIKHVIGMGEYKLELFTDAAKTEKIFEFVSDENIMTLTTLNIEFQNSEIPPVSSIYAKITPTSGSGHQFMLKIFANLI